MPMPHRTLRGRIVYTSRKSGREGVLRGDERFTITQHADGTRTLRAICEGYARADGRFSQRLPLPGRAPGFGAHPIQSDAWLTRLAPDRPTVARPGAPEN